MMDRSGDIGLSMDVFNLFLPKQNLQDAADEQFDGKVNICEGRELFGFHDPVGTQIVHYIFEELQNEKQSTNLYFDSLMSCLYWRLARKQSQFAAKKVNTQGSVLTIRQASKAVDYLQASVFENPSLGEVSKECGASQFHFARGFSAFFGMAPHQYFIALKLKIAMERLKAGRQTATEVAFDLGFSSQSQFNKVLKSNLGMASKNLRLRY